MHSEWQPGESNPDSESEVDDPSLNEELSSSTVEEMEEPEQLNFHQELGNLLEQEYLACFSDLSIFYLDAYMFPILQCNWFLEWLLPKRSLCSVFSLHWNKMMLVFQVEIHVHN